ncbi:MAG: histidine kinase, partial [Bacteroidetes bacterium]|nr:histidine kinase [Bacteroidota bacterium]
MLGYIRNIIYSPYFLSLPVAIIIILLLPPLFQKIKIAVVEDALLEHKESIHYYEDLDNDGNTELIIAYGDAHGQFCFQVYDHFGGVAGQWNFPGEFSRYTRELYFGDVDNNGILEVYGFTVQNDSIFLSAFEPLPVDWTLINLRFTDKYGTLGRQIDFNIPFFKVVDLEDDGKKEIFFSIAGGFSLTPRKIYRYDYLSDSIISSQSAGSIISEPILSDLNNDGFKEITGSTNACENIPDTMNLPYKDHSSWLFIFDHDLQLTAPPVEFPGGGTRFFVSLLKCGHKTCIFAFHHSIGHESNANEFLLFNRFGKIVKQNDAPSYSKKDRFSIVNHSEDQDKILLLKQDGELWVVDSTLQVIRKDYLGIDINSECYVCDVNFDGKNEWLFKSTDGTSLIISNPDLNVLATFPTTGLDSYEVSFHSHQEKPFLVIQDKKRKIILQCSAHPYYIKLIGSWILIYLGVLVFVLLIRKIQLQQIRAKEKIAGQILSLQLQSTSNQLDPHFTFNVFNTISAMLQQSREMSIHKSFLKFTELMRITLLSSGSITRSL